MKTGSWFTAEGPGRIGISRGTPRGQTAGYRLFKALAPGSWFNSVDRIKYENLYFGEIVAKLDAKATWERLHQLVFPHEPILLCFESSKGVISGSEFCHRRMAAHWLEQAVGEAIPEEGAGQSAAVRDLFSVPAADVTPWIEKTGRSRDGRLWRVVGPRKEHPDQAEIVCDADGEIGSVSLDVLQARFS